MNEEMTYIILEMNMSEEKYEKLYESIWELLCEHEIEVESLAGHVFPKMQRITFEDHN